MAELPAELTDRVIDFLHLDNHALAACSLVCKSWIPASRYHLFGEITIASANAHSFFKLFESATAKEVLDLTGKVPTGGVGFYNYVRNVSCKVDREPVWLTESVMQTIASLPLLSEFSLVANTLPMACPPLVPLKNIQKLEVLGRLQNPVPCVAKAIANNPNLECLDVSSNELQLQNAEAMPQLQELFADIPPHSPPLRLRHLGVIGFRVRLESRVIPHLRSLTSFECVSLKSNSIESVEFWRTLKSEGIRLSRLKTSMMNDSLLDFLSSFQGMKYLYLARVAGKDDGDSDRLARIFFEGVLPRHAKTLETLHICPLYEGDWCFGNHNVTAFMNSTNLRELETSVHWPERNFSGGTPVIFLLNSTATFPRLALLRLHMPLSSLLDARHGNLMMQHRDAVFRAIQDAISKFDPQPSGGGPSRLPVSEIRIHGRKFEWREGKYHSHATPLSWSFRTFSWDS